MDSYYIGAYWGDRKEDLNQSVDRFVCFIEKLASCDELFRRWYQVGTSRKDALRNEVQLDRDILRRLFEKKGSNRTDIGKKVIPHLGVSQRFWNGKSEDMGAVGLSICCGLYAGKPGLMNSCVMDLPYYGLEAQRFFEYRIIEKIIQSIVYAWEPDWAGIYSRQIRDLFDVPIRTPNYGWIIFLSQRRGNVPFLPEPSRVTKWEGLGSLISLTDERLDVNRQDHINLIRSVYFRLDQAGLLGPTPQVM